MGGTDLDAVELEHAGGQRRERVGRLRGHRRGCKGKVRVSGPRARSLAGAAAVRTSRRKSLAFLYVSTIRRPVHTARCALPRGTCCRRKRPNLLHADPGSLFAWTHTKEGQRRAHRRVRERGNRRRGVTLHPSGTHLGARKDDVELEAVEVVRGDHVGVLLLDAHEEHAQQRALVGEGLQARGVRARTLDLGGQVVGEGGRVRAAAGGAQLAHEGEAPHEAGVLVRVAFRVHLRRGRCA